MEVVYSIQRRKGRDRGALVTWYEVMRHEVTPKGNLIHGEVLKVTDTKKQAEAYCRRRKLALAAGPQLKEAL